MGKYQRGTYIRLMARWYRGSHEKNEITVQKCLSRIKIIFSTKYKSYFGTSHLMTACYTLKNNYLFSSEYFELS